MVTYPTIAVGVQWWHQPTVECYAIFTDIQEAAEYATYLVKKRKMVECVYVWATWEVRKIKAASPITETVTK